MQLFADDQGSGNAGWIAAAGVAVLALLREAGNQMGLFAGRKQTAVNEVVKGQGDLIAILQDEMKEAQADMKASKAENRECNQRTARLEREVIRLGGNPDALGGTISAEHEPLKPGIEENDL